MLEKTLKPNKTRIVLGDGRELQYHRPQARAAEPIALSSLLPVVARAPVVPQKLEVEIGPGKGEFLSKRAACLSDRFFIGIDRRIDRIRLTEKKLIRTTGAVENEGRNWKIVYEDARSFLMAGLPPIDVLHVYHPDPWPKSRHHKHRFFRSPDARAWAEALVVGGQLRISTDHAEYFEEILDIVMSWPFLKPRIVYQKQRFSAAPQSYFEGLFLKKGKPVFKLVFERIWEKDHGS